MAGELYRGAFTDASSEVRVGNEVLKKVNELGRERFIESTLTINFKTLGRHETLRGRILGVVEKKNYIKIIYQIGDSSDPTSYAIYTNIEKAREEYRRLVGRFELPKNYKHEIKIEQNLAGKEGDFISDVDF